LTLNIIVAMDSMEVIARGGDLPWGRSMKSDLKHFKELTTGKSIVMGRKTLQAIGKALPNRRNIVLTRDPNFTAENCEVARSWDEARELVKDEESVFVIGGAEVYKEAMNHADKLYVTRVKYISSGGERSERLHFPIIDDRQWQRTEVTDHPADDNNPHPYRFEVWERVAGKPSGEKHVDVANAYTPEYRTALERITEQGGCPTSFCGDGADYHNQPMLSEGEYWKVTINNFSYQQAEHKFLVIHKKHIQDFAEISPEAWIEFQDIVNQLVTKYQITGGAVLMRFGDSKRTGASVVHLHGHLVVGYPRGEKSEAIKPVIGFSQSGEKNNS
jgi:dihydrofolate reductase